MTADPFSIEEVDGEVILHIRGPFDLASVRSVCAGIQAQIDAFGSRQLIINLSALGAADHIAIAVVQDLIHACSDAGRPFHLTSAAAEVQLQLIGAETRIEAIARTSIGPMVTVPFPERVGRRAFNIFGTLRDSFGYLGDLCHALFTALRRPRLIRWRDALYYMENCGADAVPIVVLICLLMGVTLGFQSALQMHTFGADIYVADLVGLSIAKELGPLMVAMICTGRAGSAFAAEIGTMKVAEEVDALVTMGLDPHRFLIVPKVLALMVVMPVLTLFGDIVGIAGGFLVGMNMLDIPMAAYYNETIFAMNFSHFAEGLIKSVIFAFLISAVGCRRGLETDGGAQGVGVATTSAVVSGIFLVIIADTLMTWLFAAIDFGVV